MRVALIKTVKGLPKAPKLNVLHTVLPDVRFESHAKWVRYHRITNKKLL